MMDRIIEALARQIARLPVLNTLTPEAYRDASRAIEEAVETVQRIGDDAFPKIEITKQMIVDLRRIGDPSAAEIVAESAADAYEQQDRPGDAASMLNFAGLTCSDQSEFMSAEEHYLRALNLLPEDDPHNQRSTLYNNYGNALTELSRFEEATSIYEQALRDIQESPRERFVAIRGVEPEAAAGTVINNQAWSYLRRAIRENEPKLLAEAIKFLEQTLSSSLRPRTRIIAMGNLAEAHLVKGDDRKAEEMLITLEEECNALKLHRLLSEVYRRKAQICAQRLQIEEALDWSREAMRSSLQYTNPRQELRIVEVFFQMLDRIISGSVDRLAMLEGEGALVLNELLDLLKSKDVYTGEDHSRRVGSLSKRIAEADSSGKFSSPRWLKHVEFAGLLHDVGKLMVPWSLLNRLRPLSHRELLQLQRHALVGEELLAKLGLPELAVVAGEHHERPDGTGYPRGKAGLTDMGAMVAVADSYEAMTSPSRGYRQPLRPREAVTEILEGSGRQFDPKAATALSRIILKGGLKA